jgi:hypothetical protein
MEGNGKRRSLVERKTTPTWPKSGHAIGSRLDSPIDIKSEIQWSLYSLPREKWLGQIWLVWKCHPNSGVLLSRERYAVFQSAHNSNQNLYTHKNCKFIKTTDWKTNQDNVFRADATDTDFIWKWFLLIFICTRYLVLFLIRHYRQAW